MSGSLKVMTFNIRHGRAFDGPNRWYLRRDLVFEVIKASSVHVLALQEAHHFQLEELLAEFPVVGLIAGRRYGGPRGTHAAILFDAERFEACQSGDFWLAPDPDGSRVRAWDAAVARVCNWVVLADRSADRARFAVFNTHLDQAGPVARHESARLIASRVTALSHIPRLVVGDLNAGESSDPVRTLRGAGFRDSFRVVRPDEEANTYHRFRGKGVKRLGKIDYILCDDRWGVIDAAVIRSGRGGRFPSDHFPVTAELAFGPQRRR
ncbi:MAG: endonuclease/exonuclease/phosphatase family protein [Actinomycetota bacterium]